MVEEEGEFFIGRPALSLGDVACNRDSRSPRLGAVTVKFCPRKGLGDTINLNCKLDGLLPSSHFLVGTGHGRHL